MTHATCKAQRPRIETMLRGASLLLVLVAACAHRRERPFVVTVPAGWTERVVVTEEGELWSYAPPDARFASEVVLVADSPLVLANSCPASSVVSVRAAGQHEAWTCSGTLGGGAFRYDRITSCDLFARYEGLPLDDRSSADALLDSLEADPSWCPPRPRSDRVRR